MSETAQYDFDFEASVAETNRLHRERKSRIKAALESIGEHRVTFQSPGCKWPVFEHDGYAKFCGGFGLPDSTQSTNQIVYCRTHERMMLDHVTTLIETRGIAGWPLERIASAVLKEAQRHDRNKLASWIDEQVAERLTGGQISDELAHSIGRALEGKWSA